MSDHPTSPSLGSEPILPDDKEDEYNELMRFAVTAPTQGVRQTGGIEVPEGAHATPEAVRGMARALGVASPERAPSIGELSEIERGFGHIEDRLPRPGSHREGGLPIPSARGAGAIGMRGQSPPPVVPTDAADSRGEYYTARDVPASAPTMSEGELPTGVYSSLDTPERRRSSGPVTNSRRGSGRTKLRARIRGASPLKTQDSSTRLAYQQEIDELKELDPALGRLDSKFDHWGLMMKKSVMEEFAKLRMQLLEENKARLEGQAARYENEIANLRRDLDLLQGSVENRDDEMLKKDRMLQAVADSLAAQRARTNMRRAFLSWRAKKQWIDTEEHLGRVAAEYLRRRRLTKALSGWAYAVKAGYKDAVQAVCQRRAEEVCRQIQRDYEAKMKVLHGKLEAAHGRVRELERKNDRHVENMKKAFMRGVCALNMEAMSMFRPEELERMADVAVHGGGGGSGKNLDPNVNTGDATRQGAAGAAGGSRPTVPHPSSYPQHPAAQSVEQQQRRRQEQQQRQVRFREHGKSAVNTSAADRPVSSSAGGGQPSSAEGVWVERHGQVPNGGGRGIPRSVQVLQ
eukprot:Clim_evm4s241 gene=Clim_evmTU4s241